MLNVYGMLGEEVHIIPLHIIRQHTTLYITKANDYTWYIENNHMNVLLSEYMK